MACLALLLLSLFSMSESFNQPVITIVRTSTTTTTSTIAPSCYSFTLDNPPYCRKRRVIELIPPKGTPVNYVQPTEISEERFKETRKDSDLEGSQQDLDGRLFGYSLIGFRTQTITAFAKTTLATTRTIAASCITGATTPRCNLEIGFTIDCSDVSAIQPQVATLISSLDGDIEVVATEVDCRRRSLDRQFGRRGRIRIIIRSRSGRWIGPNTIFTLLVVRCGASCNIGGIVIDISRFEFPNSPEFTSTTTTTQPTTTPSDGSGESPARLGRLLEGGTNQDFWIDETEDSIFSGEQDEFILLEPRKKTFNGPGPMSRKPSKGCEPGWKLYCDQSMNCKCYMLSDRYTTWSKSKHYCEKLNAELVSVKNNKENVFLSSLLEATDTHKIFLAARRVNQTNFYWTDGSRVDFDMWEDGEPLRDCAVFLHGQRSSSWVTSGCEETSQFVCQKIAN